MRNRGFTLVELMIVVIIVGILASLAIGNYSRIVEKGRAAEAKKIMSLVRQQEFTYYLENNRYTTAINQLGFSDLPTGSCSGNFSFQYGVTLGGTTRFNVSAIRCTGAAGKQPGCPDPYRIRLIDNGTYNYNDSRYQ